MIIILDTKRKHAVARAHRQEDAAVVLTCTGIHQRCLTRNKAAVESFETLLAMGSVIYYYYCYYYLYLFFIFSTFI